jgi:hypothetical protein
MWEEERRDEKTEDMRWAEKSWEELRKCEKNWQNLRSADRRRLVKSREELNWDELRRTEQLTRAEKIWEKVRWHEKRWEKLWSAETSWEKERRHEMRWDEMGWCRLQQPWDAMSSLQEKLRCDEIIWNEKKWKDPTLKSQEFVVAKRRRPARTL